MKTLSKSQTRKVASALDQHDRHAGSYFWTPDGTASGRRRTEQTNSWTVRFRHGGHVYEYESYVRCSCKNYYYTGTFSLDGVKQNRRLFANLPVAANPYGCPDDELSNPASA